jgi:rod shape-determining protein MreB
MPRSLAIDLGTANTLVYVKGSGVRLSEPTVIAINQRTGDILALGDEAHAMLGRAPEHMVIVRPLRGGAISDFETTARLLSLLYRRVGAGRFGARPRVVVGVPMSLTKVERRAVQEAAVTAGARGAYLIEEPLAAAIGAGLPIAEVTGCLVVDVGGGTTQVACIASGGIVTVRAVRVGGFDMDAAIQQHIRREYNVAIGEQTAERLKTTVGSAQATSAPLPERAEARGRDIAYGLPKTLLLSPDEVRAALEDPVSQVVQTIVETLAASPPELATDILDKGMVMTGGGSLLRGLDARITKETGIVVHHTDDPMQCVVQGIGQAVEYFEELSGFFVDPHLR